MLKVKSIGESMTEIIVKREDRALVTNRPFVVSILVSYETPVACHIEGVGYFKTSKKWSKTTSRHISQWLREAPATIAEKPQEFFDNLLS